MRSDATFFSFAYVFFSSFFFYLPLINPAQNAIAASNPMIENRMIVPLNFPRGNNHAAIPHPIDTSNNMTKITIIFFFLFMFCSSLHISFSSFTQKESCIQQNSSLFTFLYFSFLQGSRLISGFFLFFKMTDTRIPAIARTASPTYSSAI